MDNLDSWQPVKKFLQKRYEEEKVELSATITDEFCAEFMFMAWVNTRGKKPLWLYKHRNSRRYLNLDSKGNPYAWILDKQGYVSVSSDEALAHVGDSLGGKYNG